MVCHIHGLVFINCQKTEPVVGTKSRPGTQQNQSTTRSWRNVHVFAPLLFHFGRIMMCCTLWLCDGPGLSIHCIVQTVWRTCPDSGRLRTSHCGMHSRNRDWWVRRWTHQNCMSPTIHCMIRCSAHCGHVTVGRHNRLHHSLETLLTKLPFQNDCNPHQEGCDLHPLPCGHGWNHLQSNRTPFPSISPELERWWFVSFDENDRPLAISLDGLKIWQGQPSSPHRRWNWP